MNKQSIYHTEVVNQDGGTGVAYVKNNGLSVAVSSPLSSEGGSNPEELLGLAYSTRLNATIQAVLKEQGKNNQSRVQLNIGLIPEEIGYHFDVEALVWIAELSLEDSQKIAEAADLRCPISKLLAGSQTVAMKVIVENN